MNAPTPEVTCFVFLSEVPAHLALGLAATDQFYQCAIAKRLQGPSSESIYNSYIAGPFSMPRSCTGLQRLGRKGFLLLTSVRSCDCSQHPKLDVRMARGPEDNHLIVPSRTHQNGPNALPTVLRAITLVSKTSAVSVPSPQGGLNVSHIVQNRVCSF